MRDRRAPKQLDEFIRMAVEEQVLVVTSQEPLSYKEAMRSDEAHEWKLAMDRKIESLRALGVWELTVVPPDRKAVGCKWVYKRKFDAQGKLLKYKARLVDKGFTQQIGIDYNETYAPVMKLESLKVLLATVAQEDWELHQVDVKTAYLYGELEETIYMQQPEGYIQEGDEDKVCHLLKGLYGLKQSGRC